ncbi:MAG: hypothetical protein ACI88C_000834 [Acidimicrobiales bacterium]|jgi:hypothetical protein
MADEMADCGLNQMMVDAIAGDGIAKDGASCLFGNIHQDVMRSLFPVELTSDDDAGRIGEATISGQGAAIPAALGAVHFWLSSRLRLQEFDKLEVTRLAAEIQHQHCSTSALFTILLNRQ